MPNHTCAECNTLYMQVMRQRAGKEDVVVKVGCPFDLEMRDSNTPCTYDIAQFRGMAYRYGILEYQARHMAVVLERELEAKPQ